MNARPWYREPMVLLVIALPAAAVVAGVATLVLAAGGDPSKRSVTAPLASSVSSPASPSAAAARSGARSAVCV
jgi:hypothetical protein